MIFFLPFYSWSLLLMCISQVHSLATMISLKMEIPECAWKDDPNGIALANYVNSFLPRNIKVFSILPSQK